MKVCIFLGSESDYPVVEGALEVLKEFDVEYVLEVTSAHRTPARTQRLIKEFEQQGARIFIALAGKAAHLAGVVAAHTTLPVIGVPVGSSALSGMDALFSTVQMPKGVPVACMGIGKSGAANAALLAVQILSLEDTALRKKMRTAREKMAEQVELSSERLKKNL